jgi:hypothetical protein
LTWAARQDPLPPAKKVGREIDFGPTLTARQMVSNVKKLADGWEYDLVSIGYPGPVVHDRLVTQLTIWEKDGGASTSSTI